MAENLRAVGVKADELDDGLEVVGGEHPLKGRVKAFGDHRIAMAFGVLGALPGNEIVVDPARGGRRELSRVLARARARAGRQTNVTDRPTEGGEATPATAGSVLTIDGPAGSGKSTTARAVADR